MWFDTAEGVSEFVLARDDAQILCRLVVDYFREDAMRVMLPRLSPGSVAELAGHCLGTGNAVMFCAILGDAAEVARRWLKPDRETLVISDFSLPVPLSDEAVAEWEATDKAEALKLMRSAVECFMLTRRLNDRTWLSLEQWADASRRLAGSNSWLTPLLQGLVVAALPPETIKRRWRVCSDGPRMEYGGLIQLADVPAHIADLEMLLNQPVAQLRVCKVPNAPRPSRPSPVVRVTDTCKFGANQRWEAFRLKAGKLAIRQGMRVIPSEFAGGFSSLREIVLNQVEVIGEDAFAGCDHLRLVTAGFLLRIIGNGAFRDCVELAEFRGGISVVERGVRCFANDRNLVRVHLGSQLRQLRDGAFQACSSLRQFVRCRQLTTVGDCVFQDCSALECIAFPKSLGHPSDAARSRTARRW
jgi:hypothetical protein